MTMARLREGSSVLCCPDDLARGAVDGEESDTEGLKPINVVSFARCWGDVLRKGRSEGVREDGKGDSLSFCCFSFPDCETEG
jgi:hypothetical protein